MSEAGIEPSRGRVSAPTRSRVNDVIITVATSNGTGSQSANLILMRSILTMGIPVGGKNMFPSNIQGLPTWFTVRANGEGWVARRRDPDVFVAMNIESVVEDIASLRPGATLVVTKSLASYVDRSDLHVHVIPFDDIVAPVCREAKLRKLVVNIVYVGVLAHLLGIEMDEVKKAIARQFSRKASATTLNTDAAVAGYDWARANVPASTEHTLVRGDATRDKIIIEGNQAAGMGLMFGGLTVLAWYPITPSSSLAEACIDYMQRYRHEPETGQATYAIIQAEDELASMAAVVGAGWAGARAATATAGPGISLMSELVGLAYFAEIPAVLIDVQRMGPSTGLPTRTCQGDIVKAYNLSHGDCKHPLLIPANPTECFEMAAEALDLAERLQTVVFVMLDLDLGMNSWMGDPFVPITKPIDRGKVLSDADLAKVDHFARYKDVDGDGICYRTLPGTRNPMGTFFTRGTGHTEAATYSEKPKDWKNNMDRLTRKFDTARKLVPHAILKPAHAGAVAEIGVIAFGSTDPALEEARVQLRREHGIEVDYLRLRALPIDDDVRAFIATHRVVYVVEQNRDAQCAGILRLECPAEATTLRSVLHYSGMPIDPDTIVEQIVAHERVKENGKS